MRKSREIQQPKKNKTEGTRESVPFQVFDERKVEKKMGYVVLGVLVFALDILTKVLARAKLMKVATVPIWEQVFHLTYVENKGIAFGMFGGGRIFFILFTVLVLGLLLWFYCKSKEKNFWIHCGTSLVLSGALGNLFDRIFRGFVVDFLDFRLIDFPVFNIADIAVCVGAVMLVIFCFISEEKREDESVGTKTDVDNTAGE